MQEDARNVEMRYHENGSQYAIRRGHIKRCAFSPFADDALHEMTLKKRKDGRASSYYLLSRASIYYQPRNLEHGRRFALQR